MTRNHRLASTTEVSPTPVDDDRLNRLIAAVERLADRREIDPELQLFTPEEAAELLAKTPSWVVDSIHKGQIPFTRVGQSPRLSAAHIRWVQANGEQWPNKYAKPIKGMAKAA